MRRTLDAALAWSGHGARLVGATLARWDDADLDEPTPLSGWARRHVVAHLAANAEAVGRLVHWAQTGEPTPMYSSAQQRSTDIEEGSRRTAADLRMWFEETAEQLASAMAEMTERAWDAEVVTAQGRAVPASETPWMRAREVMVHAVDLGAAETRDLPLDFLRALGDDVVAKRNAEDGGPAIVLRPTDDDSAWALRGRAEPTVVEAPIAEIVAFLTGRPHTARTPAGQPAPPLSSWL
ncbi:maleylpyruvate isomerase family mycothiol-dependent enzyme [Aeromicrobium sp. CTD01-1L150]|uniref:maleylpyruvate isomerase family mycothiol-dependent enzyme n=1 Tax=Aeromicrobium sp. CTD01-1L150 TaxID=3341830 RepID=UPI0035C20694